MKKQKGVSLIVLVITIIIIIILAGAVILNLSNNNPIDNANKAKIMQDMDTFKSDLALSISDKFLEENGNLSMTDINASTDTELIALIPSIVGTEYVDYLAVKEGKIVLKDELDSSSQDEAGSLSQEKKEIIKEVLEIKVEITSKMIEENPMKYIGKKVKYTNYDEETVNQEIDWRIFGLDENKNIILKANDCVSLKYKKSLVPAMYITITGTNSYCIKGANGKIPFMNYMTNVNNWSEFAVEGKTEAKAAMTIKEFVDSYNSVNEEDLEIEELVSGSLTTKDGTFTGKAPGWVVKKATSDEWNYNIEGINITTNVGEVPEMNFCIADYDNYIAATWLASDSAYATSCLMAVGGTNRSYRI